MSRRRIQPHTWSLDPLDPVAIANARIALALMRCVRRLPGAFGSHNFDDLGAALAPVLEIFRKPMCAALEAHFRAKEAGTDALQLLDDRPDLSSPTLLHQREVQTLLGEALARQLPRFRAVFDKVEEALASFATSHALAVDRNIELLVQLVRLPAPEATFLGLAAALCHSTIQRSLFDFVDSPSRLLKAVEWLCGVRGAAALRLFDANRPLAQSGLLAPFSRRGTSRDLDDMLCLSGLGERLLSAPFDDAHAMSRAVLSPMTPPAAAARLSWPHLERQQALLRVAIEAALQRGSVGFNVLLHGGPGTGKTEFVRQLVAAIGACGFVVEHADDEGDEASREERLASLLLSQTFAGEQQRAVLVLDEAEDIFQNDYQNPLARLFQRSAESKAWMNSLLEGNPHPVIWISNRVGHLDPAYLRRFSFCMEFPQTPYAVRQRIAHERLAAVGCSEALVDAVAAVAEVTPALLDSAARFVELTAGCGDGGADEAVRVLIDGHLKAAGHAEPPLTPQCTTRFDLRYLNVAGNATPQRVLAALERAGPATLLFSGAPGTGKTQLAAEIARRLGRRLVVRTASDIHSKWYGESEGNVARMFRDCDPAGEVLFLDEAEVLLGARETAVHRADQAVTAEFLRWLEVFQGTFVCATNHAAAFDAALMRRFTFRLEFQPLGGSQRLDLYRELALGWHPDADDEAAAPCVEERTATRLARLDRLTPGDFANAARRIGALGLDSGAWIDELEAEQGAKSGHATVRRVGFL